MEPDIIIIKCSPFIPEQVMEEFVTSLPSLNISKEREPIYRQRSIEHFDAKPIYDVVIEFVSKSDFLKSVLKSTASALVIEALKAIFKKVAGTKKPDTKSRLKINLSYEDMKAEFSLEGTYTSEDIDNCIESFKNLAESNTPIADATNEKYQRNPNMGSSVKYEYDEKKKIWIPHDYENDNKELFKRIQDLEH